MKPLIAIHSCSADIKNGRHNAIRETWLYEAVKHADVRFFVGRENDIPLIGDEVQLDTTQDPNNLVDKEAAMLRWGLNQGYKRILKTETDVYINVSKMFQDDIYSHDVIGRPVGSIGKLYSKSKFKSFYQGHAVWYSGKAARVLADNLVSFFEANFPAMQNEHYDVDPSRRSADLWSGQVLSPLIERGELTYRDNTDYSFGPITWHYQGDFRVEGTNAMIGKNKVCEWMRSLHMENTR